MEKTILGNYRKDRIRYGENGKMPKFQFFMRKYQDANGKVARLVYKILFVYYRNKNLSDLVVNTSIGGLYIGHA